MLSNGYASSCNYLDITLGIINSSDLSPTSAGSVGLAVIEHSRPWFLQLDI